MTARDKVKPAEELKEICRSVQRQGRRVVFTNGCFDILHVGHVRYLESARGLGDLLIVGVNSDKSVKQIKGPDRPLIGEEQRAELVAALQCVDYVSLFDAPDPLELIDLISPDILVKGADWPLEQIIGRDIVVGKGGAVVRIPFVPGSSTTSIINRILTRFSKRTPSE